MMGDKGKYIYIYIYIYIWIHFEPKLIPYRKLTRDWNLRPCFYRAHPLSTELSGRTMRWSTVSSNNEAQVITR